MMDGHESCPHEGEGLNCFKFIVYVNLKATRALFSQAPTQVVCGTQSREKGGREYAPAYILDSVLLADRLKVLEEMRDAVGESPWRRV